MGMMGKLKEPREKVKATKERLHSVTLNEKSQDGLVSVTITANRSVKSIEIDDSLLADKEQLEDYLILVINNAIEAATKVQEAELSELAKDGMPNIPGFDSLFP